MSFQIQKLSSWFCKGTLSPALFLFTPIWFLVNGVRADTPCNSVHGQYLIQYSEAYTQFTKKARSRLNATLLERWNLELVHKTDLDQARQFGLSLIAIYRTSDHIQLNNDEIRSLKNEPGIHNVYPDCIMNEEQNAPPLVSLVGHVRQLGAPTVESSRNLALAANNDVLLVSPDDGSTSSLGLSVVQPLAIQAIDGSKYLFNESDGTPDLSIYVDGLDIFYEFLPGAVNPYPSFTSRDNPRHILRSADVFNDGGVDSISVDTNPDVINIKNFGSPSTTNIIPWRISSNSAATEYLKDVQVADINGDGLLDLVSLQYLNDPSININGFYVVYRQNQGLQNLSGPFAQPVTLLSYSGTLGGEQIQLKDADNDGDSDLFLLRGELLVFERSPAGFVTPGIKLLSSQQIGGFAFLGYMEVADVVGFDGLPEVILTGEFVGSSILPDGHLLLVLESSNGSFGTYYINGFTPTDLYSGTDKPHAIDYDGDGDLDIVVNRTGSDHLFGAKSTAIGGTPTSDSMEEDPVFNSISVGHGVLDLALIDTYAKSGALVTVTNVNNPSISRSTRSGIDGEFIMHNLPQGAYSITVTLPSQVIVPQSMTINLNQPITTIIIEADNNRGIGILESPPSPIPNQYPDDPAMSKLWGLHNFGQMNGTPNVDIDAPEAWNITQGSNSVVVAVLDGGLDYNHPDIAANVWTNPNEVPNNGIDDDSDGYIDDVHGVDIAKNDGDPYCESNNHGTHVSGIISARRNNGTGTAGVAPNVKLLPIRIIADGTVTTTSTIIAGFQAVLSLKSHGVPIKVLNGSFGSQGSCIPPLQQAISAVETAGITLVFSAGNDGENSDQFDHIPSGCSGVGKLTVASIDRNGNLANSSNFGLQKVDLAAPGVDILSTFAFNRYHLASGTSMAAPHVAGVAALLASHEPNLNISQIRDRILSTVKPLLSLQGKTISGGAVSAYSALSGSAITVPTPPETQPSTSSGANSLPGSEIPKASISEQGPNQKDPLVSAGIEILKTEFKFQKKLHRYSFGVLLKDPNQHISTVEVFINGPRQSRVIRLKRKSAGSDQFKYVGNLKGASKIDKIKLSYEFTLGSGEKINLTKD